MTAGDEARGADWTAAMRAGDFGAAWAISDRDLQTIARSGPNKHEGPRHLQRIWRGEPLDAKRVLVRCYHGLGDTIQFARFLSPLRAIASEVVVWCQPELLPLLSTVDGVDRVLPLTDGEPSVAFDVDMEIMEIPHAIRATRELAEIHRPYLKTNRLGCWGGSMEHAALTVGLVWNVGDWDHRRRAVPARLLRRLASSEIRLFSLQRGETSQAAEIGAVDISTPDFQALAARLRTLDLVVCPDTMVAHLSAALGCDTWIMLHAECDWRWPTSGSTTYWYPSARLFHQRHAGDWSEVVEEIGAALSETVKQRRARSSRARASHCSAGSLDASGVADERRG